MLRLNGASMIQRARSLTAAMLASILLIPIAGCSDITGEQTDGPSANPLLYEIASADGAVEGWMVGTIHALPTGTQWRTPTIAMIIDEADVLLVEVAALNDRAAMAGIFAELSRTPGQPAIERRVPENLAPALEDLLDRAELGSGDFSSLETWAAALMLAQVSAVGDPANGIDRALIREFDGRTLRELEGAQRQLSIFDRLPEAQQRKLLAAVVTEADGSKAQAAKLQRAWLTGDIAVLEQATRTGILADPDLRQALLINRNRDWVATIVPMLEHEPRPLIAVGAAHLVGAEGLATMLETRGYRVRRLP